MLASIFPISTDHKYSPINREFSKARQLGIVCVIYANDHQGKFPDKLRDLVPTYIKDEESFKKLMFCLPDDKSIHEWSYFGSQSANLPPTAILIASPVPWSDHGLLRRIVIYADGSAEVAHEENFRREIKAQRQAMRAAAPQPAVGK